MLKFVITESHRSIEVFDSVRRLSEIVYNPVPEVEIRENGRVFDGVRLALHLSANVSKMFWPPRNKARGEHLRRIVGLADDHPLRNRDLRNHVEHIDERLDSWTEVSPRAYFTTEHVMSDLIQDEQFLSEVAGATVIMFDPAKQTLAMFGEEFSLIELRSHVVDVSQRAWEALMRLLNPAAD